VPPAKCIEDSLDDELFGTASSGNALSEGRKLEYNVPFNVGD